MLPPPNRIRLKYLAVVGLSVTSILVIMGAIWCGQVELDATQRLAALHADLLPDDPTPSAVVQKLALDAELARLHDQASALVWGGSIIGAALIVLMGYFLVALRVELRLRSNLLNRYAFEAEHDPLTGLLNRRGFGEYLDHAIAQAERTGAALAVMYLDLDGFKAVNDRYGHAVGDQLLRNVARFWQGRIRKSEILARLGGDEFALIVHGDCEDIPHLAERLLAIGQQSLLEQADAARVGVSIGVASYPQHGQDRRTLIAAADNAMYLAKQGGKHRWNWPAA